MVSCSFGVVDGTVEGTDSIVRAFMGAAVDVLTGLSEGRCDPKDESPTSPPGSFSEMLDHSRELVKVWYQDQDVGTTVWCSVWSCNVTTVGVTGAAAGVGVAGEEELLVTVKEAASGPYVEGVISSSSPVRQKSD